MAGGMIGTQDAVEGLNQINWRQLGVTYGAPYFLASLCFYFSALATANRRHGAFTWFVFACVAGFPTAFLIDFEPGWWRAPSLGEISLINAAALAVLLAWAVWDLRQRGDDEIASPLSQPVITDIAASDLEDTPEETAEPSPRPRRRGPVPAAIARQRQLFAEHGRKQLARQRKRRR